MGSYTRETHMAQLPSLPSLLPSLSDMLTAGTLRLHTEVLQALCARVDAMGACGAVAPGATAAPATVAPAPQACTTVADATGAQAGATAGAGPGALAARLDGIERQLAELRTAAAAAVSAATSQEPLDVAGLVAAVSAAVEEAEAAKEAARKAEAAERAARDEAAAPKPVGGGAERRARAGPAAPDGAGTGTVGVDDAGGSAGDKRTLGFAPLDLLPPGPPGLKSAKSAAEEIGARIDTPSASVDELRAAKARFQAAVAATGAPPAPEGGGPVAAGELRLRDGYAEAVAAVCAAKERTAAEIAAWEAELLAGGSSAMPASPSPSPSGGSSGTSGASSELDAVFGAPLEAFGAPDVGARVAALGGLLATDAATGQVSVSFAAPGFASAAELAGAFELPSVATRAPEGGGGATTAGEVAAAEQLARASPSTDRHGAEPDAFAAARARFAARGCGLDLDGATGQLKFTWAKVVSGEEHRALVASLDAAFFRCVAGMREARGAQAGAA